MVVPCGRCGFLSVPDVFLLQSLAGLIRAAAGEFVLPSVGTEKTINYDIHLYHILLGLAIWGPPSIPVHPLRELVVSFLPPRSLAPRLLGVLHRAAAAD